MDFKIALQKLANAFDSEKINYMLVGGFATAFYNKYRYTADIDCVIQMYPHQIPKIVQHFPDWKWAEDGFIENAKRGIVFNFTDFESAIKIDFMLYQDSDYNWEAFQRREKVAYYEVETYIASKEDLIISKLMWYNISQSGKQMEDIEFLLTLKDINMNYIKGWTTRLLIKTHGLF